MSETVNNFDLVVIGGGPAGMVGATTAAYFGKTVAVVDSHHELGGAGANTGTVPSKTLRETALALSGIKSRNLYGVDLSLRREATVSDFLRHERNVQAGLNGVLAQRMVELHIGVYTGTASFEDPHTVRVRSSDGKSEDQILHAGNFLIATGSSPVRPATFPFDLPGIYDSDTILGIDRLPERMAVVGAGVIGSEYACTFAALGTKVHLLDSRDVLLPFLDAEISGALAVAMERSGITFHWLEQVNHCDHPSSSDSSGGVRLALRSGETLTVDAVLVAAGRKSNVASLNLSAAGVIAGDRGLIAVDEFYRTGVAHIFAAGDVIGFPALASTSMEQARRAVRHAFGVDLTARASGLLPTGVYTIPEVSMVGETEESLTRSGVDYVVGRAMYISNGRGRIIGDTVGFLKLLFQRSDLKLLGVHVIGEQATELVHVGLMVLLAGSGAHVFDEACFNIPTLGALYKTATLDAFTQTRHASS
jgi:NAD(P) transhydrogenase